MSSDLLQFHAFCLTDTGTRLDQYARAIALTVHPGDVVVDIGAGTGILSYLAAAAGARVVYAIEASDALWLGQLLGRSGGAFSRVQFIRGSSTEITLPEQANVIVADIHDTFGLQGGGLATMLDARNRFLTSGGALIPSRIQLLAAPVEAPEAYRKYVDVWQRRVQGLELSAFRQLAVNQRHPGRFEAAQLLAAPQSIGAIDLLTTTARHIDGRVRTVATRAGIVHGVCGCFVTSLADGIDIGNVPGDASTTNFAQAFFPIESPQPVAEGDVVSIGITSIDGEARWQIEFSFADGRTPARFDHSTFLSAPLRADFLHKQADDYHPRLTARGTMERELLAKFDGTSTSAELERWLTMQFGDQLPSAREAAAFLKATIDRCG